jgi:hypothetical protein
MHIHAYKIFPLFLGEKEEDTDTYAKYLFEDPQLFPDIVVESVEEKLRERYVYIYIYPYIYVYIYLYMYPYIYICLYVCICMYVYVCIYMYIHIHTPHCC